MSLAEFLPGLNVLSIGAFLLLLVYLLWRDRDNIERHSIVFVRRTKHGIEYLDEVAGWSPRIWKIWSTLGIVVGFGIMVWITALLAQQTLRLFLVGDAAPPVGPVLPTVSTVTNPVQAGYLGLPFWHFMIALSVVLFVHEGMHGVIARVEGFVIRSVGLILLGIIPGAFVQPAGQRDFFEPEPEEGTEQTGPWGEGSYVSRLRVLAAGPFANVTVAILLAVVLLGAFTTAHGAPELRGFYEHEGMRIMQVANNSPAASAGLEQGMVITKFDAAPVQDMADFQVATQNLSVGQVMQVETQGNGTFTVTLDERPQQDGNYSFTPAAVDYLLPLLERQVPGAINTYESYNNWLVQEDRTLEIARWHWIQDNYPSLSEEAQQQIQQLAPQQQPEDGYMGVVVAPEQEVKAGLEPYVGPLFLVFQVLFFVALLNFMIGAANLLPIKGLDGGWMVSVLFAEKAPGIEPRVTRTVTLFTILMVATSFAFLIARYL